MSVDWSPALHAWPGRLVKDYPGAEPRSLLVGRGGNGCGVGRKPKIAGALVRAAGAGSWWRCLGDGGVKGAACVCRCMWSAREGIPPTWVPFGERL